MKINTIFGIMCGVAAIFGAFLWHGGTLNSLIMLPAMLIVFGGTLAAALAGTTWEIMSRIFSYIRIAFFPPKYNTEEIINQIIEFSIIARKEGVLAVEPKLEQVKHPFLGKLFQICIDGADPDTLHQIVETEISYITDRHNANILLFTKMGGYSPTMGIIGTVMGLISTLAAAGSDPSVLIHNIASAFIATMWGIFMANIVWLPIGEKLRTLHNEEMQIFQVMLDGVHSVQLGEPPTVIRQKLITVFPLRKQEKLLRQKLPSLEPKTIVYYPPVENQENQNKQ
jgi:chemotaxis protein MotA